MTINASHLVTEFIGVWTPDKLLQVVTDLKLAESPTLVRVQITKALREQVDRSQCQHKRHGALVLDLDPKAWTTGVPLDYVPNKWHDCGAPRCRRLDGQDCPAAHVVQQASDAFVKLFPGREERNAVLITTDPDYMDHADNLDMYGMAALVHWPLPPMYTIGEALEEVRRTHDKMPRPPIEWRQDIYKQLRELLLAIHHELSEVADATTWKPYGSKPRCYARHQVLTEVADVLIYADLLIKLFEADWAEMADIINAKTDVIRQRIGDGYYDN